MTELPKNMVLLTSEYYEELLAAREREIDNLCLEAIERIEARKAAGVCKYRPAEEFFQEFEAKHGIRV